ELRGRQLVDLLQVREGAGHLGVPLGPEVEPELFERHAPDPHARCSCPVPRGGSSALAGIGERQPRRKRLGASHPPCGWRSGGLATRDRHRAVSGLLRPPLATPPLTRRSVADSPPPPCLPCARWISPVPKCPLSRP